MMHKEATIPNAAFYEAVGLGGFSSQKVVHVDNTGIGNISHLNRFYCELTGLHHVWRNTQSKLVGICHYRRYLNVIPLASETMGFLSAPMNDVVLQLLEDPRQETRAQELLSTYDVMRAERRNFYCNLMIAERHFFDHYCSHMFAVIDRVFKHMGTLTEVEGARYQPYRYPGYLAERFMVAFINVHRMRFYETAVISID